MKKQLLITVVAISAYITVFAGTRFVSEGWYLNVSGSGTRLTEAQARISCPGGSIPCAYHFAQGAATPDMVLFRD